MTDPTVARTTADSAPAPADSQTTPSAAAPASTPSSATTARSPEAAFTVEPASTGPVRVARKVARAAPARPAVRRVARTVEPPIIPVEPAAETPAAPALTEAPPDVTAAEPVQEATARRGLFRRVVDAFRGGNDQDPPSPGPTRAVAELPAGDAATNTDTQTLSRAAVRDANAPTPAGGAAVSRAAAAPAGSPGAAPSAAAAAAPAVTTGTVSPSPRAAATNVAAPTLSRAVRPADATSDPVLSRAEAGERLELPAAANLTSGDAPTPPEIPTLSRATADDAPAATRAATPGRLSAPRTSVSRALAPATAPIGAAARALARKASTDEEPHERPHLTLVTPEHSAPQPQLARSIAAERLAAHTGGSLEQGEGGLSTVHFPPPAQPGLSTFEPYTVSRAITLEETTTSTTPPAPSDNGAATPSAEGKPAMDPETLYEYFLDRFKRDLLIEREQLGHLIIDNP